jgi:hypothetical protein
MQEVRTAGGQLVGVQDTTSGTLQIKIGRKYIGVDIPPEGLRLTFDNGHGTVESVYINQ